MLQVAADYVAQAAAANTDLKIIDSTAAHLAIEIAATPGYQQQALTQKVQFSRHVAEVAVNTNGTIAVHEIDPGPGGIVEGVGLVVLAVAVLVAQQEELEPEIMI